MLKRLFKEINPGAGIPQLSLSMRSFADSVEEQAVILLKGGE